MPYNPKELSSQEEIYSLFRSLGDVLTEPVKVLTIGGAALIEYDLKDATKDVDIICVTDEDKKSLLECALNVGFELKGPEKRHRRLGLDRIAIKNLHTIDIFARTISGGFIATANMWYRAINPKKFGLLDVRYASIEDIFIMKLIAHRDGDLEDCAKLVTVGLDFDIIYDEVESQYISNLDDSDDFEDFKIWITYLDEGVGDLELKYGISIPISDKISKLSDNYYNNRFK
jgi:hypothetical protein